MSDINKIQVLNLIAEENYAHARDHEHLRAQITSILLAGCFVLIGLLGQDSIDQYLKITGFIICTLMGVLNFLIVLMHNNRIERHIDVARQARNQISEVIIETKISKFGSLNQTWLVVALIPSLSGLIFLILLLNNCK